jgi:hypothetical protein
MLAGSIRTIRNAFEDFYTSGIHSTNFAGDGFGNDKVGLGAPGAPEDGRRCGGRSECVSQKGTARSFHIHETLLVF